MRKTRRGRKFFTAAAAVSVVVIAGLFLLTACVKNQAGNVFSTNYSVDVWGGKTTSDDAIRERLTELETRLSPAIETSDVARINTADVDEAISVSEDTVLLIQLSKKLFEQSGGAYNPAIFPVVKLWGFDPKNYDNKNFGIPSDKEIQNTLTYCDFDNFELDAEAKTVTKRNYKEAELDFGAIAKGLAADAVSKLLVKNDDRDYLTNIGGTLLIGDKDHSVGVLKPYTEKDLAKVLTLSRLGAATSGTYFRNFTENGIEYHHVIGKDGYPAGIRDENPKISVTVVAGSSAVADMLSTAGMLLGEEDFTEILSYYNASAYLIYRDQTERFLNGFEKYVSEE